MGEEWGVGAIGGEPRDVVGLDEFGEGDIGFALEVEEHLEGVAIGELRFPGDDVAVERGPVVEDVAGGDFLRE